MGFTRCPVCGGRFRLEGPDGVLAHVTAFHPFSAESRWIARQLALLNPAPPEPINAPSRPERHPPIGVTVIHAQPA
jgi:hypothetical protein